MTYVYVDISQKQEFIYKNNQLIDNLKRSVIIKALTEDTSAISEVKNLKITLNGYLSQKNYAYNFTYSAGGNSIIQFKNHEEAIDFIKEYSKEVLEHYPTIQLYMSYCEVDSDKKVPLKDVWEELHNKADSYKDQRRSNFRRWSYGIEQIDETGLPVSENASPLENLKNDDVRRVLSNKIMDKIDKTIEITCELDDYKSKTDDEDSYIGIIALDGNKMGEMVNEIINKKGEASKKEENKKEELEGIDALRTLSQQIDKVYTDALVEALNQVSKEKDKKLLITPIVMAGDDLCLITEGRYAIQLASQILKNIETKPVTMFNNDPKLSHVERSLTACAGVAIVRATYPFFESVRRAEAMCEKAKEKVHKVGGNASFIDWEIVQGSFISEDAFDKEVKEEGIENIYHIKPLLISQKEGRLDKEIGHFDPFAKLVNALKDETHPISNTLLETIKSLFYTGYDYYQWVLNTKIKSIENESSMTRLNEVIAEIYRESIINGVLNKDQVRYYLLNDVIGVKNFFEGGAKDGE